VAVRRTGVAAEAEDRTSEFGGMLIEVSSRPQRDGVSFCGLFVFLKSFHVAWERVLFFLKPFPDFRQRLNGQSLRACLRIGVRIG
jgi:hypothetical protein